MSHGINILMYHQVGPFDRSEGVALDGDLRALLAGEGDELVLRVQRLGPSEGEVEAELPGGKGKPNAEAIVANTAAIWLLSNVEGTSS